MPRQRQLPDEPVARELSKITDSKIRVLDSIEWLERLTECTELLKLLPDKLSASLSLLDKARILNFAMKRAVASAYVEMLAEPERKKPSQVLAAAALVGLISGERPKDSRQLPEKLHSPVKRLLTRTERLKVASSWYFSQTDARWFRPHENDCLAVFRDAIAAVIADGKTVREIATSITAAASIEPEALGQSAERLRHALDFPEQVPYISRPSCEQEFQIHIDAGHRLIAIEGEPGNGKSRLARELLRTRLQDGGAVAYIRNEQLLADIVASIAETQSSSVNATSPKQAFASFVSAADAPDYVLLDNVDDTATIEELVPPSCRSLVVVTSRESLLPPGRGAVVAVKQMEGEEAPNLVRQLRPRTSETEITRLVRALGARPLAIIHALGLIGDGDLYGVEQFCADIERDAADTLSRAVRPIEWTLTWIYERMLRRFQESDDAVHLDAAIVLELVAFLRNEGIPQTLVALPFCYQARERFGSWPAPTEQPLRLASAYSCLRRFYLLEVRPDGLAMHPLTHALLAGILKPKAKHQCATLFGSMVTLLKERAKPNIPVSGILLPWLPHVLKVAEQLLDLIHPDKWEGAEVFGALSIVLEGLRQAGQGAEVIRICRKYIPIIRGEIQRLKGQGRSPKSEGFLAFMVSIITSQFDAGEFDIDEYLERIGPVLTVGLEEGEADFGLIVFLTVAQRMLDAGRSPLDKIDELDTAWPDWQSQTGPEFIAEIHRLRGEAHLLLGQWEQSRAELEAAWELSESMALPGMRARTRGRLIKNFVDLDCYSGVGIGERALALVAELDQGVAGADKLVDAIWRHVELRVYSQIRLLSLITGSPLSDVVRMMGIPMSVRSDLSRFLLTYQAYMEEGSVRYVGTLAPDLLAAMLGEDDVSEDLAKLVELVMGLMLKVECWPNPLMGLIYQFKVLLLQQGVARSGAIDEIWNCADATIDSGVAPHLACEAILVGTLARAYNQAVEADEMPNRPVPDLESVRQQLMALGLGNRWGAFENVKRAIEDCDKDAYLRWVIQFRLF